MNMELPTRGPDGHHRRVIARSLLDAWTNDKSSSALLVGRSGLGKTDCLVSILVDHATDNRDLLAVSISVPAHPTNIDEELLSLVVEQLREIGNDKLAQIIQSKSDFGVAVKELLAAGGLVVIDEFQRLLDDKTGCPVGSLAEKFQKIARRVRDKGYLVLVSSRTIDAEWSEPFRTLMLDEPTDLDDQLRIMYEDPWSNFEIKFPADRRIDVINRLGANPRLLKILRKLLDIYELDELLGDRVGQPDATVEPKLTDKIETALLSKTKEGLSEGAAILLRRLSIFDDYHKLELIQAMVPEADLQSLMGELRARFLIDVQSRRYRIHPPAREVECLQLRKDPEEWRAAHRLAGMWYATPLFTANLCPLDDAELALRLAGARYHFTEAEDKSTLQNAMQGISKYIEKKFGWNARRPNGDAERDVQISLLGAFLEQPGDAGVEYNYAKLLKSRGAKGDLIKALPHAERATTNIKFSEPWILRIKLLREVRGAEDAIAVAQEAIRFVEPGSGLVSIYHLLGSCQAHLGQIDESVKSLLAGTDRIFGAGRIDKKQCEQLLIHAALSFASAEKGTSLLQKVLVYTKDKTGFKPEKALAEVLLLERAGEWRKGAEAAQKARSVFPDFFRLALHEAFCFLAANEPAFAHNALSSIPDGLRENPRQASMWLASLIALHNDDLLNASRYLSIYLDSEAPNTECGIREVLLHEWDHRIATVGEENPSLSFPILPSVVTKLSESIRRPQYGSSMLPQNLNMEIHTMMKKNKGLNILSIATEWGSGHGGLSTFNRQLCLALVAHGARVVCLVCDLRSDDSHEVDGGVTILGANRTRGQSDHEALQSKPTLPADFVPDIIIGHGRVTGIAAKVLVKNHYQMAKRIHFIHMAPDEIEWHKDDRDDDPAKRAEERTELELDLGSTATLAVTVGPYLHNRFERDLTALKARPPLRFDPGFDVTNGEVRKPPKGDLMTVLLLGRMEDETLKGLDIAARAIGQVVKQFKGRVRIEFIVRGVKEGTSPATREKIFKMADTSDFDVLPRLYTTDANRLSHDLQIASLVLMPSRTEGFGLTGLEAIVAGTPVLVSQKSGLGELLIKELETDQSNGLVVSMLGTEKEIVDQWSQNIYAVLRDRDAAFNTAEKVRTQLSKSKTWEASVKNLLTEINARI